jgi:hypothetical protein
MKPSDRGALKLARKHGEDLLCVRYRESEDGTERITTVELVVERTPIQKRDDPVVSFKIRIDELDLRAIAQAKGAVYDPVNYMWKLKRSEVLRMGLRSRIAVTSEQLLQEHVLP